MGKKIILSAKQDHYIVKNLIELIRKVPEIDLKIHDPKADFLDLENLNNLFEDVDLLVVKVGGDASMDLLHYAKLNSIPTIQNIDTILLCKNKVALDHAMRKIFNQNKEIKDDFALAHSWTYSLDVVEDFVQWADDKLPIVLKSHYQHEEYNRFNFLMREPNEIDTFLDLYGKYLFTDLYIQKFIECDGIDRKVYVIGENVFGVKRENPIYIYLRDHPKSIDVEKIETSPYEISKTIKDLALLLSKELDLNLFGFDLIKSKKDDKYYLIDLNDFPGFRGVKNASLKIFNYIMNMLDLNN
jgi:glutathione synthase/RimK-type ligase-like ATP-grasp enzyme